MRILFLTQYFRPETGAPQARLHFLGRYLASRGHRMSVLTALPNYPHGKVMEGYRGKLFVRETMDGMDVRRVPLYLPARMTLGRRMFSYFSFTGASLLAGLARLEPQDVVFTESPPLPLGATGLALARKLGALHLFNVSDLWPRAVVELGAVREGPMVKAAYAFEKSVYRASDLVTGQTEGIVEYIRRRVPHKRVELLPNGVEPGLFSPGKRDENLRRQWTGADGSAFVVGYAGNIGISQGLEIALKAARRLRDEAGGRIVFVIVGEGVEKKRLEKLSSSEGLSNVIFFPHQLRERMPAVVASFDAALVPVRRSRVGMGWRPFKMFEALSAGVPLLLGVDGEARRIVEAAGGGIFFPPDDDGSLAEAVRRLAANRREAREMGRAGRKYVADNYDLRTIASRFESFLEEATGGKKK